MKAHELAELLLRAPDMEICVTGGVQRAAHEEYMKGKGTVLSTTRFERALDTALGAALSALSMLPERANSTTLMTPAHERLVSDLLVAALPLVNVIGMGPSGDLSRSRVLHFYGGTATYGQLWDLVAAAQRLGTDGNRTVAPGEALFPEEHPSAEPPAPVTSAPRQTVPFQDRARALIDRICRDDPTDLVERRDRFLEEALEYVQVYHMTEADAHALVSYVFGRPVGEPDQELGGLQTTLAALVSYAGQDMAACGERDLEEMSAPAKISKMRDKRSRRHGRGPLPGTTQL